jgi:hypothetical protein
MKKQETTGAHWKRTGYSPLYQLSHRVETVASRLERRRRKGWVPTKDYIRELYEISRELKLLDKVRKTRDASGSSR